MSDDNAKVLFMPSGRRGVFSHGTSVLDAARSIGVDLDSVCGGRAMCGRCQVECASGKFSKHAIESKESHLSPMGASELSFSERRKRFVKGRRLGCQALIQGDLVIDVPAESQTHRQVVRKRAEQREITLDANTHLYFIEVQQADIHDPSGDMQRIALALANQWALSDIDCDPMLLPTLQATLRRGDWHVTVAVHAGQRITAIWPGLKTDCYGLAVDIGSTTIAAHLCSLVTGQVLATDGIMNPQIRFGEDLMSRVSYIMMQPEGALEMTRVVREGVNKLITAVAKEAKIDASDIVEVTVAGNPIMHHLFLGISPIELGGAPFALAVDSALDICARDVGLNLGPAAKVYVLPCIAGHVGADAAAMVLAEEPHRLEEMSLVVDVGTNAEIVLGNRERLLACSSPTGPAFEGAQISCGQRAAPGAIERVRIDPDTFNVRFSVIGSELWSDDEGFTESISRFGVTGICGSGIIEAIAEMFLAGIITIDGVVDGSLAEKTDRIVAEGRTFSFILYEGAQLISVTQTDVRQIQLAKAALYAGIKLLMDKAGITHVDRIRLAGAFGSHIDTRYAMVIGLIPDCELDKVSSAGNAAGTGARIALLNTAARREIEAVVADIEKIETAIEPKFQDYFVDAMAFPNKTDPFDILFATTPRPLVRQSDNDSPNSQRPRRRRKRG